MLLEKSLKTGIFNKILLIILTIAISFTKKKELLYF